MIISKHTKIEMNYMLNEEEGKLLKSCLEYVKHRITKHPECGARTIGLKKVEKLLAELE